jgi:hypothetical protein
MPRCLLLLSHSEDSLSRSVPTCRPSRIRILVLCAPSTVPILRVDRIPDPGKQIRLPITTRRRVITTTSYMDNGLDPTQIQGRFGDARQFGPPARLSNQVNWVADPNCATNDPNRRNFRILATTGGYTDDNSGQANDFISLIGFLTSQEPLKPTTPARSVRFPPGAATPSPSATAKTRAAFPCSISSLTSRPIPRSSSWLTAS